MEFETRVQLDNIGIIHESTIQLDGLTVITGHNNSGKTTVGKVLYALFSAVENIYEKAEKDKIAFVKQRLKDIYKEIINGRDYTVFDRAFEYMNSVSKYEDEAADEGAIIDKGYRLFLRRGFVPSFDRVSEALQFITFLYHGIAEMSDGEFGLILLQNSKDDVSVSDKTVSNKRSRILKLLENLTEQLYIDPDLIRYTNRKIENGLRLEFNNQILPVRNPGQTGSVRVFHEDKLCFELEIKDNRLEYQSQSYYQSVYSDAVFIDNVFVIDSMAESRKMIRWDRFWAEGRTGAESWNDKEEYENHEEKLLKKLIRKTGNVYEEIVNQDAARVVFEKINGVFPDEVVLLEDGYYCSENRLDVRNLATGSKMFAIIKILLEKGQITSDTLLILDEPESHLHPKWQNEFAEMIVLLIKYMKVHVLLTTHSPNFLMALETYAHKHDMWKHTNVYCTEKMKDGYMVQYVDVKERMKIAYGKLADPLFELQRIKVTVDEGDE